MKIIVSFILLSFLVVNTSNAAILRINLEQDVVADIANLEGYQATITTSFGSFDNPQTRREFVEEKILEVIKLWYKRAKLKDLSDQAEADNSTAIDNSINSINIVNE